MKIEIEEDRPGDECAACKSIYKPRELCVVNGKRLALCAEARQCGNRWRKGLNPAGYAQLLREGSAPL